jgi:hypothetical protein
MIIIITIAGTAVRIGKHRVSVNGFSDFDFLLLRATLSYTCKTRTKWKILQVEFHTSSHFRFTFAAFIWNTLVIYLWWEGTIMHKTTLWIYAETTPS